MGSTSARRTCKPCVPKWRKTFPLPPGESSMARQATADRAWKAIARFYDNCQAKKPGKKGYPRFQPDNRSVEYKTSGWKLEPEGKRLTQHPRARHWNHSPRWHQEHLDLSHQPDQARPSAEAGRWLLCAICRAGRSADRPPAYRETGRH